MCLCGLWGALPDKPRLRLFLRNSSVTAEVNAGHGTAGLASHYGRGSHENRGGTVNQPTQKQNMQGHRNGQRCGLPFRNGGMELRKHWPGQAGLNCILPSLYLKINRVRKARVDAGNHPATETRPWTNL